LGGDAERKSRECDHQQLHFSAICDFGTKAGVFYPAYRPGYTYFMVRDSRTFVVIFVINNAFDIFILYKVQLNKHMPSYLVLAESGKMHAHCNAI